MLTISSSVVTACLVAFIHAYFDDAAEAECRLSICFFVTFPPLKSPTELLGTFPILPSYCCLTDESEEERPGITSPTR